MKQDVETPVRQRCDRGGRQLETQASSVPVNLTVQRGTTVEPSMVLSQIKASCQSEFRPVGI